MAEPLASVKTCTRCRLERPLGEFRLVRGRWHSSWCNGCHRARTREWNRANSAKVALSHRSYYDANRETISSNAAARYAAANPPASRICGWCGVTFIRRRASKLCSDNCRWHWNQARQNAKPNILTRSTRLRILNRDGWHCYLCDQAISRTAVYPDPASGTADHVIPRKHGGPDDDGNLGATHWRCNARKGSSSRGFRIGYDEAGEPYLLVDREYFAA